MKSQIKTIANWIFDLIFPKFCVACEKEGSYICLDCQDNLKIFYFPFCPICKNKIIDSKKCGCRSSVKLCLAPFSYDNIIIQKLIHQFKYKFIKSLGYDLADFMIESLNKSGLLSFSAIDPLSFVIVPVPLHKRRLAWRGFNQAEILAKGIAEKLGLNFSENLKRQINTKPQIEMQGAKQREETIKNAFACKNPDDIKDKIVILVDDMITTGATLEECAKILKQSGAKEIWAITIAR